MSYTKYHLDGNTGRHQGRFGAALAYQRGLDALLVSQRCAFLDDADELPLIWMLTAFVAAGRVA